MAPNLSPLDGRSPYEVHYRDPFGIVTITGFGALQGARALAFELHAEKESGDVTLVHSASETRFCVAGQGFKILPPAAALILAA